MLRIYLSAATVTAVVTGGLLFSNALAPRASEAPKPSPLAKESTRIYAAGVVEGTTPEVEIRSEMTGRVVEIAVDEGNQVEQGSLLFRLDSSEQQANLATAKAALELAKGERQEAIRLWEAKVAQLEGAEKEWRRLKRLLKTSAASQRDTDNQESLVNALRAEVAAAASRVNPHSDGKSLTEAQIDAARANVQLAEVMLDRTVIRAPRAGQVLAVNIELGELAGAEGVEPSVIMADCEQLHVRAYVEELDAPSVRVGDLAYVNADGVSQQDIPGKVVYVSPRMAPKKLWRNKSEELFDVKTREVLIELLQPTELVIGLDVDVSIERAAAEDVTDQSEIRPRG